MRMTVCRSSRHRYGFSEPPLCPRLLVRLAKQGARLDASLCTRIPSARSQRTSKTRRQGVTLRALRRFGLGVLAAGVFALVGCGHTDEEMAAKQREIDKLSADLKAAQAQIATDQTQYSDAQSQIDKLKSDLQSAGLTAQQSQDNAAKLQQALAEYKQRA